MPEWKIVICGLVLVILAGCRRDNTPLPPMHASDADALKSYRPIRIPDRRNDAVLGPIVAAEQAAAAEKKDKGGEAGSIDDSSAEAAAKSFVAIVLAGDLQQLSKILVAEQAEVVGKMAEGLAPLTEAAKELKLALDEKFPDNDIAGFFPIAPVLADMLAESTKFQEIKPGATEDEAEATIAAGADGSKSIKLTVKKVDSAWRVMLPDFTPPADVEAASKAEPEKVEALKDIARRVQAEELKDADAVKTEVQNAVEGKYKLVAPEKAAAPAPAPTPEPPKAAPAARPRERDAVDDTAPIEGLRRR
jgi:hypothetical protein